MIELQRAVLELYVARVAGEGNAQRLENAQAELDRRLERLAGNKDKEFYVTIGTKVYDQLEGDHHFKVDMRLAWPSRVEEVEALPEPEAPKPPATDTTTLVPLVRELVDASDELSSDPNDIVKQGRVVTARTTVDDWLAAKGTGTDFPDAALTVEVDGAHYTLRKAGKWDLGDRLIRS